MNNTIAERKKKKCTRENQKHNNCCIGDAQAGEQ